MTLTLALSPDLEQQIQREAARKGISADEYALQLLEDRLKQERVERNRAAIRLLQLWIDEGDEEEQRETFEALKQGLDENRMSDRPLFPPDGSQG